jgi:hypothetical protein
MKMEKQHSVCIKMEDFAKVEEAIAGAFMIAFDNINTMSHGRLSTGTVRRQSRGYCGQIGDERGLRLCDLEVTSYPREKKGEG